MIEKLVEERTMKKFLGLVSVIGLCWSGAVCTAGGPTAKSDVCKNDGFLNTGHVGLADGGSKTNKMLEVMPVDKRWSINGTCVHYGRTWDEFKKGDKSAAARYDKSLSSSKLATVYDVFKKQGDSYKASYWLLLDSLRFRTTTKDAWVMKLPCKANNYTYTLEKKTVTGDARLRCDFTVATAYREGASKDLASTGNFLPSTVYNKLPNAR